MPNDSCEVKSRITRNQTLSPSRSHQATRRSYLIDKLSKHSAAGNYASWTMSGLQTTLRPRHSSPKGLLDIVMRAISSASIHLTKCSPRLLELFLHQVRYHGWTTNFMRPETCEPVTVYIMSYTASPTPRQATMCPRSLHGPGCRTKRGRDCLVYVMAEPHHGIPLSLTKMKIIFRPFY